MNLIELKNVTKSFEENGQERKILDNVNLTILAGEFIILKGTMGAGKTTLINLILGLQMPESGTVSVFGYSPEQTESKLKLGLMLQKTRAPENLTVEETINLIRSFYSKSYSTNELLRRSNLEQIRYNWASSEKLCGGEERSLYFALAIAGNPELLILDEPTTGLDTAGRTRVLQQIRDFADEGKTIMLVSHIESDIDTISDLKTRTLTLINGQIQEVRTEKFEQVQQSLLDMTGNHLESEKSVVKAGYLLSICKMVEESVDFFEVEEFRVNLNKINKFTQQVETIFSSDNSHIESYQEYYIGNRSNSDLEKLAEEIQNHPLPKYWTSWDGQTKTDGVLVVVTENLEKRNILHKAGVWRGFASLVEEPVINNSLLAEKKKETMSSAEPRQHKKPPALPQMSQKNRLIIVLLIVAIIIMVIAISFQLLFQPQLPQKPQPQSQLEQTLESQQEQILKPQAQQPIQTPQIRSQVEQTSESQQEQILESQTQPTQTLQIPYLIQSNL